MPETILNCPQCERPLRVTEGSIGRLVQCPACGLVFLAAGYHSAGDDFPNVSPDWRGIDSRATAENEFDRARSLTRPPAIFLLLVGILGFLVDVGQVLYAAEKMRFPAPPPAQPPRNFVEELERGMEEGAAGPPAIIMGGAFALISILVIIAAVQMLRLRTYGLAMTGSVLAMVNLVNCCCLLGLPAGVWALWILSRPEVKSAFQQNVFHPQE